MLSLLPLLLLFLTLITTTTSQSTSFGTCITSCLTANPLVKHCTGTETGKALSICTCQSYRPSDDPLINCVFGCPGDQQLQFAQSIPVLCGQTLFLGLNLSGQVKPWAVNSATAATTFDIPTARARV